MSLGIKYYLCPGAFVQYRNIPGALGRVLGVWSALMQAIFSYAGSEVPGIAGAEVENPGTNIPRAVRNIWKRIFLFYVVSVFIAGLIVPYSHAGLSPSNSVISGTDYVQSSPFVIAMNLTGIKVLPYITSALFLLSAWSAATSDVYVSSRYFFFLARQGHAPRFLDALISIKDIKLAILSALHRDSPSQPESPDEGKRLVVPLFGILIAAAFGSLAILPSISNSAQQIFYWLSSMTSAAVMLSWVCMMVTYLRWHAGTKHLEEQESDFNHKYAALYENTRKHRNCLQPYLAWYGIIMCNLILLLHGWAVFSIDQVRRIAEEPGNTLAQPDPILGPFVLVFVTSYLPIPMLLLCIFGYKLIMQTNFVKLHEMNFEQGEIPPSRDEPVPTTLLGKLVDFLI